MSRKHRATANPELARTMHGKRTSNAAGVHAAYFAQIGRWRPPAQSGRAP